jgi:hypothetical protein
MQTTPHVAVPRVAALSFATLHADERVSLWAKPPASSYAEGFAEGERRAAEFIAFLQADGEPSGLLFGMAKNMGLAAPHGAERACLAGFFFKLERALAGSAPN